MNRTIKFRAWMPHDKTLRYNISVGRGKAIDDLDAFFRDTAKDGLVWMQYTGLKDKNGKEIYEGDVVRSKSPADVFEVKYELGGYFRPRRILEQYDYALRELELEVIGNVFEHPNLLPHD